MIEPFHSDTRSAKAPHVAFSSFRLFQPRNWPSAEEVGYREVEKTNRKEPGAHRQRTNQVRS